MSRFLRALGEAARVARQQWWPSLAQAPTVGQLPSRMLSLSAPAPSPSDGDAGGSGGRDSPCKRKQQTPPPCREKGNCRQRDADHSKRAVPKPCPPRSVHSTVPSMCSRPDLLRLLREERLQAVLSCGRDKGIKCAADEGAAYREWVTKSRMHPHYMQRRIELARRLDEELKRVKECMQKTQIRDSITCVVRKPKVLHCPEGFDQPKDGDDKRKKGKGKGKKKKKKKGKKSKGKGGERR